MPTFRSQLILTLVKNRHLFQLKWKQPPFDPTPEGIRKLRETAEKGAARFGKLTKDVVIEPLTIGQRYAEWVKAPGTRGDSAMLYFHGGMYVIGSPQSHRPHTVKFVKGSGINALVFDYRMAPEHPFPAGLNDAVEAYEYLLDQGFQPSKIVFAGDSAGGGLCLATLLAIKERGLPLPARAAVLSPWTDLALSGASYETNKTTCLSPLGSAEHCSEFYAGNTDKRNPLVSPLYGDLKGLPPLYITVSDNEILMDDSVHFAEKASAAGVDVSLVVGHKMCHCYPAFAGAFPEATREMAAICAFLKS